MSFGETTHVASVLQGPTDRRIDVRIYNVPGNTAVRRLALQNGRVRDGQPDEVFYWCCEACGACGKHKPNINSAVAEAHAHVNPHRR